MDAKTCTWVTYTSDGKNHAGKAVIKRENEVIRTVDTGYNVPHNFQICLDFDALTSGPAPRKAWAAASAKATTRACAPPTQSRSSDGAFLRTFESAQE